MGTRVKICGIQTTGVLDAASRADWVGFVFFAESPRYLTPVQAAALLYGRSAPKRVGLFVAPSDADVLETLRVVDLDVLQVYASETRVEQLRILTGLEIWRSVGVDSPADLPERSAADALVVEPRPLPGSSRPGGNALAMNWALTRQWAAPVPWMLAGGLTPDNVGEAIARSGAQAVDVSSGVERSLGIKDPVLVREFLRAARAASSPAS